MDGLDDLSLIFLNRLVCRRIDDLISSIRRCQAFIERGVDRYERLSQLELELNVLSGLRGKIAEEMVIRDFFKSHT